MEHKSLTDMLSSSKAFSLFASGPFQPSKAVEPVPEPKVEPEKKTPEEKRVVFIGNTPLDCKKKHIKHLMSQFGEVEAVWRRSIPLDRGKLPVTAAVALKKV
jgi:RNA recognition motif-containing protein